MQVVMHFGDSAAKTTTSSVRTKAAYYPTRLEVETNEMSPKGQLDYSAEMLKTVAPNARRTLLALELERLMQSFSLNEKEALKSLLLEPCHMTKLAKTQLRFMRNPVAIKYAQELIECNLPLACATREMAIIARSEYYDIRIQKAKETKAGYQKEYAAMAAKAGTAEEDEERLQTLKTYAGVDYVQQNLLDLKNFDKAFLGDFNGFMLDTIHYLKEAQLMLAAKSAVIAKNAQKQGQNVTLLPVTP